MKLHHHDIVRVTLAKNKVVSSALATIDFIILVIYFLYMVENNLQKLGFEND